MFVRPTGHPTELAPNRRYFMRLFNTDEELEASTRLEERRSKRSVPFQEQQPLLLGSGDRCERVPGSCFERTDPIVANWIESQEAAVYAGLGVYDALGLLILLFGAAVVLILVVAPFEHRWRQQSKLYLLSARTTRLGAGFALVILSAQFMLAGSVVLSSVSGVGAVGIFG